jgi:hypothetical protein
MKEKILEIMEKHYGQTDSLEWSSEEITAMVMEFVEWKENNRLTKVTKISHERHPESIKASIEETFNYWLTNIYKK